MQQVSAAYLRLLGGSHEQVVQADCWFAGQLVARDMLITDGSITSTIGQPIRSTLSLSVADPDGRLLPKVDGVLSPYGGEVRIRAGMRRRTATEMVELGRFAITDADSTEERALYVGKGGSRNTVSRGGTTSIGGADRMRLVGDSSFLVRTQPTKATVFAECRQILIGIAPWVPPVGVADRPLTPGAVTYSEDRAAALTDLAALLECEPYATPSGSISLAPLVPPLVSSWSVPAGDGGQLISLGRKLDRTNVHNGVIAQGTAFTGAPLRGVAVETSGPLRWGGPFGKVPAFIDAPLAISQAEITAAARSALTAERRSRWQQIDVSIIVNYGLQAGDVITVPAANGPLIGIVTSVTYPLKPTATMGISMSVDPFVLAQVI